MTFLSGKTALYGVMGNPIIHSVSPSIHNFFAKKKNEDMIYVAFSVHPSFLERAILGAYSLGICGLNVTLPYKQNCMNYLCDLDKTAEKIGSVNTLVYTENGYKGYNTDCIGMKKAMETRNINIYGRSVVVLGAGGSARAACFMAAESGASSITIVNRTLKKADDLAEHIKRNFYIPVFVLTPEELEKIKYKEIVIQTTSLGFGEQKGISLVSEDFFDGVDAAFDIIYNPWETRFLEIAKKAGVNSVFNGLSMLVYQAAAAYEIWRGIDLEENILTETIDFLLSEMNQV